MTRPSHRPSPTAPENPPERGFLTGRAFRRCCRSARRTALTALALGALAGCGKNTTSPLVPDCAGNRLLVFASDRGQAVGQFEVWLYDFDGVGFRLLQGINSKVVPNVNPTISGDGTLVALVSARSGNGDDILVYDRCLGTFISRSALITSGAEGDPAFTYDSRMLAFVRDTLGNRRIRLLDGVPDLLVPLPGLEASGFDDHSPSPDEDAGLIAFVSNRAGNQDVFVYDAAGDSIRDIPALASSGDDVDPWLTPDGNYLAFASNRLKGGADLDIFVYDLVGESFVAVDSLQTTSVERNPTLNNSGDLVVFQSDRPGSLGKWDLWNYSIPSNVVGRSPGQSSTSDDVQPWVRWP